MSEPVKCKLCGGTFETTTVQWGGGGTDQHGYHDPFGGSYSRRETKCAFCGLTPERADALHTAARKEGARVALEAARTAAASELDNPLLKNRAADVDNAIRSISIPGLFKETSND